MLPLGPNGRSRRDRCRPTSHVPFLDAPSSAPSRYRKNCCATPAESAALVVNGDHTLKHPRKKGKQPTPLLSVCEVWLRTPAVTRARFFCCLVFTCDVIKKISLLWVLTWPAIAVSSEIWVLVLGVGFGGWVLAVGAFCSQQPQRKQANRNPRPRHS